MPNYRNGKIYKIVSHQSNQCYVGSTQLKYLSSRLAIHKQEYKKWLNGKAHNTTSFEILKYDDAKIILLESFPCNSKDELTARERHYIEQLNCVNQVIPTRTRKEYYDDNKSEINNKKKKKIECPVCQYTVNKGDLARHNKSAKHNNNLIDYVPDKPLF